MYGVCGLLYISLIGRDDRGTGGSDTLLLFTSMKTKPLEDVGMAVPKTAQTRYMDGSVQATGDRSKSNAIPTSFFHFRIQHKAVFNSLTADVPFKKLCRDGITCVVFPCPVLPAHCHPVCVVFGTAIPTSLYPLRFHWLEIITSVQLH